MTPGPACERVCVCVCVCVCVGERTTVSLGVSISARACVRKRDRVARGYSPLSMNPNARHVFMHRIDFKSHADVQTVPPLSSAFLFRITALAFT